MTFDPSAPEPFRVDVVPNRDEARVCPVGELDLATVPSVDAELAELWAAGFTRLVLDLRDVRFLDSTGVRMLLSWHGKSSADGMVFTVISGPPEVERVLVLTGVAGILTYASADNGSGPARAAEGRS